MQSRFLATAFAAALVACGGAPREVSSPPPDPPVRPTLPDPPPTVAVPEEQPPVPEPTPTPTPPVPPGPGTGLAIDAAAPFVLPPLQTSVETWELEIPDSSLAAFVADLYAPEQPATFRAGGRSWPVRVSLRGASARTFPKKSWNVDFGAGARFEGRRRLNLVAEYQDATMMVEKLAYDLLAAMGVKAPRGKYVRLVLNGRNQGPYLDLEQVDKSFLDGHGFTDLDATIWRCGWKDCEFMTRDAKRALGLRRQDGGYQLDWELKTNETEDRARLDAALDDVLARINHAADAELPAVLGSRLALEPYLRALAVDALISNSYVEDSESYFIHDRAEDRWHYVPWDLNNADARFWHDYPLDDEPKTGHPMIGFSAFDAQVETIHESRLSLGYSNYLPAFSNLATRVGLHPALRERLLALVERGLSDAFTQARMDQRIDAMYALLSPLAHARVEAVPAPGAPSSFIDPHVDLAKFDRGPGYLKTFVAGRIPFLRSEIARLRAWSPALAIEAVDAQQGWVELRNRGAAPVGLGGRTLTPWLRTSMLRNLPTRTLAPGERVRFTAAQLGIELREDGEVGLFDGQRLLGMHDAVFYGKVPPGRRHVRDEAGDWQVR